MMKCIKCKRKISSKEERYAVSTNVYLIDNRGMVHLGDIQKNKGYICKNCIDSVLQELKKKLGDTND